MTQQEHASTGCGLSQCDDLLVQLRGAQRKGKWLVPHIFATKTQLRTLHLLVDELRGKGYRIESKRKCRTGTRSVCWHFRLEDQ